MRMVAQWSRRGLGRVIGCEYDIWLGGFIIQEVGGSWVLRDCYWCCWFRLHL